MFETKGIFGLLLDYFRNQEGVYLPHKFRTAPILYNSKPTSIHTYLMPKVSRNPSHASRNQDSNQETRNQEHMIKKPKDFDIHIIHTIIMHTSHESHIKKAKKQV